MKAEWIFTSIQICILTFLTIFLLLPQNVKAQTENGYKKKGKASYYAHKFQGRRTSNGERYHNQKLTAAHRTLPFGTLVRVTNLRNDKSVIVRINDRGPFSHGRLIDVSYVAAKELELIAAGTATVEVEVIGMGTPDTEPNPDLIAQTVEPVVPRKINPSTAQGHKTYSIPEPSYSSVQYEPGKTYTMKGATAATKGFGVQIGSFLQAENAVNFCKGLVDKEIHQVYILVEKIKDSKKFCVVAGTFSKKKEAEAFIASLKEHGFSDGFVKKYSN
ncbi:septal ring lytic transglycosylase RlpA family protein [Cytophagaceae bacterium YF14B1]|uniref:Probable endolytic peptidoglycan transglycosylase RlpA n=1 Tax=Xanthocytophaga flava TaxID=3048013 RepID=A0AAE3QR50_9BACT|nr:septal ring lytic transglycosylase RlpA family protein [Xanthocytophaga flavus]MDJ1483366.1 septal ring lytic transglycosylase RlpA family protein [Xanthocytophaga flavus]